MKRLLQSKLMFGLGGAFLAALIFGAGVAIASIPSSNGVIWGCRNNITGSMKVIDKDAGQNCNGIETALNWNQTGPQGAQGPIGPAGPTGPQGPNGVLNIEVVTTPLSTGGTHAVHCPAGKVATSGGLTGAADSVSNNTPIMSNNKPVGWNITVSNVVSGNLYAICVTGS